jgi:hypothetical protein
MSKVKRAKRALEAILPEDTDNERDELGLSAQTVKPTKDKGPEVEKDREGDIKI